MKPIFKKCLSVLMAVTIFASGLFVAFRINDIAAENNTYDTFYDYSYVDGNPSDVWVNKSNMANYGMYAISGSGTASLLLNSKSAQSVRDGIEINYSSLNSKPWGQLNNPYVIYEVKPGTYFEADLLVKMGTNNAWSKEALAAKTGEPFEMKLEVSATATDGFKNAVDTSSFTASEGTLKIFVPEDCNFVKITFPQKGKVSDVQPGGHEVVANDMARLMGVKFVKAPEKSYDTEYDYTDLSQYPATEGIYTSNGALYGIHSVSTKTATICVTESSKNGVGNGVNPDYSLSKKPWGEYTNPYVIYKVKPGTYFEANLHVSMGTGNAWSKEAISAKTGEPFEIKMEVSASETDGWKNAIDTSSFTSSKGTLTMLVPEDCSFVKITFPQKGNVTDVQPGGYDVAANDMARVLGVRFTKFPEVPPIVYDTIYDYTYVDGKPSDVWINSSNIGDFGAYAISGSDAAGFILNTKASNNTIHDGIEIYYQHLNSKVWGELSNPYVIYKVKPGTYFEANLYVAMGKGSAWSKEAISAKTGEPFEMKMEVSASATEGFKNAIDTSSFTASEGTLTMLVPDDCNFVKITFPQKGKVEDVQPGGYDVVANDMARIMGVKYFKADEITDNPDNPEPPTTTYNTVYDYTYVNGEPNDIWIDRNNMVDSGIYAISGSDAAGFILNSKSGNTARDGIEVNYSHLNSKVWGELSNPYVIYEVKPGTYFEASLHVSMGTGNAWSKEAVSAKTGEPFEIKMEVSDNATDGWKNAVDTSTFTSSKGTLKIKVPDDCNFVKITFPQKGKVKDVQPGGYDIVANDMARILKVSFDAPKNYFKDCDSVMDYSANGPVNFFYDNDALRIYLYQKNGIAVDKFSNGVTYVAPDEDYVKLTGYSKPYVVYAVKPQTDFAAGIFVNRSALAKLGSDFKVRIYESANGVEWIQKSVTPEAVNNLDYYNFITAATTKFVKIEFPHTDAVKGVDKVNEIFGIAKVGLTPNESAYEIENPYGNYTFAATYKFYGDPRPATFSAEDNGVYELLASNALGYDKSADKAEYFLAYTYGNLKGKPSVERAGMIYSVKPGFAFQVVALTARDNGLVQIIETKLGTNWDITFEVSSDGKNWTQYNPSRILTEDHLMEGTGARYVTEVITIPSVPADVKFIKVLYPHTGDMSIVTEEAFPYVGNDLIGIAQVSYTDGGAVHPSKFKPDKSEYTAVIDVVEEKLDDAAYDVSGVHMIGLEYAKGLQAYTPAWTYLSKDTAGAVMANTGIVMSVKEGTKFFVETGFAAKMLLSELDENGEIVSNEDGYPITKKSVDPFTYVDGYGAKLYFSSDRMSWTDVTDKYIEVIKATGPLPIRQRFAIDKLPAGVKYVKVELPINRNMIGCPFGDEGLVTAYTGNDFCGIRRIYFNADTHVEYNNKINYGSYFDKKAYGSKFPTNVSDENSKVLGLYDYTPNAFEIKDYTSSTLDGRITVKESYLFGKEKVESPYLVYKVEPNSPFKMTVNVSSSARLSTIPGAKLRLYVSKTGEDGSWTEINYTYTEDASHAISHYYADNLGAMTRFLKIVFPLTGDFSINDSANAKGNTGSSFFQIREILTNLVDFDPKWEDKSDEYVFVHPNSQQQVIIPGEVIATPFNWMFVIVPVAAAIVLAGAAIVIVLIIKKKKNAAPKA